MNHKRIKDDVHRGYSAEVANAAALAALTGFGGSPFTADDIGRTVRQIDNEAIWRLTGVSPAVWHQDNGGSGGGAPSAHASTHASGGSDEVTPAAIGAATVAHGHSISDVTDLADALAAKVEVLFALTAPVTCATGTSAEQTLVTKTLVPGAVQAGDVIQIVTAWDATQNATYSKVGRIRCNGSLCQATSILNTKSVRSCNNIYVVSTTRQQGDVNPVTPYGTSTVDWSTSLYSADITSSQVITITGALHASATSDLLRLVGAYGLLIRGAS